MFGFAGVWLLVCTEHLYLWTSYSSRTSVFVATSAVVNKTEWLQLCVSSAIIRNRTDLQDYCSVCVSDSSRKGKRENKNYTPALRQCLLGSCISAVNFLPPRQQLSAGWRGGTEGSGGEEEGNSFILSSNGDVITKRIAHSPRGFQPFGRRKLNSTHKNMAASFFLGARAEVRRFRVVAGCNWMWLRMRKIKMDRDAGRYL